MPFSSPSAQLPSQGSALRAVVESAARLQQLVPEAVLVGGSAAALYANHRESFDHDHVLGDLAQRYAQVLEAVEASQGWVTSVRASRAPLTLLGSLDGIEAGLRQLRRTRPLEVQELEIPGVRVLRIPTYEETLRVKAYLIVQRNQVRDYLDVVALMDVVGLGNSCSILAAIDQYYQDRSGDDDSVLTALVQRLAEPNPRDVQVSEQLKSYKGLNPRWHDWNDVVAACAQVAQMLYDGVRAAGEPSQ